MMFDPLMVSITRATCEHEQALLPSPQRSNICISLLTNRSLVLKERIKVIEKPIMLIVPLIDAYFEESNTSFVLQVP